MNKKNLLLGLFLFGLFYPKTFLVNFDGLNLVRRVI